MSFLINPISIRLGNTMFWKNSWINFKTSSFALNRDQRLHDLLESFFFARFRFLETWDKRLFRFWMTKLQGISYNSIGTQGDYIHINIPVLFWGPMIPLSRLLQDTRERVRKINRLQMRHRRKPIHKQKKTGILYLGRKVDLMASHARGIDPFIKTFFQHKTGIFGNLVENKSLPVRFRALFTDVKKEEKRSLAYYGAWIWLRLLNKLYVKHTVEFELAKKKLCDDSYS